MQVSISVIVPIYNVSEYLRCCLDSLYSQTVQPVEVILVNDGSTDDSLAVCHQYQKEHANTVVIDKPNGGLSDARNAGTKVATGKYIYYLDGDDWLVPDALQQLFHFAEENHCEIVQGNFYYAYEDRLFLDERYMKAKDMSFMLTRIDAMQELIKNNYIKNFAWGKLYRSDIVKRHPFPTGKYFEDCYWQHHVIHEVVSYGVIPVPLYYYRQRTGGISGRFSVKGIDLLEGYEERLLFITKEYPSFVPKVLLTYLNTAYQYYCRSRHSTNVRIRNTYTNYWNAMVDKYDRQMTFCLGKEYVNKKRIVTWHLCPVYELVKSIKSRIGL